METDKQELESKHTADDIAGGDPGVTRDTVAKARQANPEQAPGLPKEPSEDTGEMTKKPYRETPSS